VHRWFLRAVHGGGLLGAHAVSTQAPGASWADQAPAGAPGVVLGAPSLAALAAAGAGVAGAGVAGAGVAGAGGAPLAPAVREALQSQKSLLGLATMTMAAAGMALR